MSTIYGEGYVADMMGEPSPSLPATMGQTNTAAGKQSDQSPVGGIRHSRNPILSTPVGQELHGCVITEADHNNERLIISRFERAQNDEENGAMAGARLWTSLMHAAIRSRRPEVVAAWEAAERQWLDDLTHFDSPQSHGGKLG